jgi:hypothetical protein
VCEISGNKSKEWVCLYNFRPETVKGAINHVLRCRCGWRGPPGPSTTPPSGGPTTSPWRWRPTASPARRRRARSTTASSGPGPSPCWRYGTTATSGRGCRQVDLPSEAATGGCFQALADGEEVAELVEQGDVDKVLAKNAKTVLLMAIWLEKEALVRKLLEDGVSVRDVDEGGRSVYVFDGSK